MNILFLHTVQNCTFLCHVLCVCQPTNRGKYNHFDNCQLFCFLSFLVGANHLLCIERSKRAKSGLLVAQCWQWYWAGAGNTVLAQYRNAKRGGTGPVQYAVTQYWPRTVCLTSPELGLYWANTGPVLYTKNLANINHTVKDEL